MIPQKQPAHTLSLIGKASEKNEKIFSEIFETAAEGIAIIDTETMRFVKCNGPARDLLKYPEKELTGMNILDICPKFQPCGMSSEQKVQELITRTLPGHMVTCKWNIIDGQGNTVTLESRLVIQDSYGPPQLYMNFVDPAEGKKAEQCITAQNKRLHDIAFLQLHEVRQAAHILGLISHFDFTDSANPLNTELLEKLKTATANFDTLIHEIIRKATDGESM
jgi:PAS domain S-box-containing protein